MENEKNVFKIGFFAMICLIILVLTIILGFYMGKRYKEIQKKEREALRNEYLQKLKEMQQLEDTYRIAILEAQKAMASLNEEKKASLSECDEAQKTIEKIEKQYRQDKTRLSEEILTLKARVEELECHQTVYQELTVSKELAGTAILKKLSVLVEAHRSMNNVDKALLEETFAQLYPTLVQDLLLQGKFSQTEKTVCLLSALNYPPALICNLTKLSSSSVTNIRSKVNKCLFGDKSASSLYKNLYEKYRICPV